MEFNSINERVKSIKNEKERLNEFIEEYKSFIASCVESITGKKVEYGCDDELSIALMAFNEAIVKYDIDKGNFLSFARGVIKNRLIDYYRKEQREKSKILYLSKDEEEEDEEAFDKMSSARSLEIYEEKEISYLRRLEIEAFKKELEDFGINLFDVAKSSPKIRATKKECSRIIHYILENKELLEIIIKKKYLPVEKIASGMKIHRKKIERCRNYIIAGVLILKGDYNYLREYIDWRFED